MQTIPQLSKCSMKNNFQNSHIDANSNLMREKKFLARIKAKRLKLMQII